MEQSNTEASRVSLIIARDPMRDDTKAASEPVEQPQDAMGNVRSDAPLVAAENAAMDQLAAGYVATKRTALIVCAVHVVALVAFSIAALYYVSDSFYTGYASLTTTAAPPGGCCNCLFPDGKALAYGIVYIVVFLYIAYTAWTLLETPRKNIRYQLYLFVTIVMIVLYLALAAAAVVALLWSNGPFMGLDVNPANDRNWPCAYSATPPCMTCVPFPMPIADLSLNPTFLVMFIFVVASALLFALTVFLMNSYSVQKLKYSTHALADPLRTRSRYYRELRLLSIVTSVFSCLLPASCIACLIYWLATSPSSELPSPHYYVYPPIDPPGALVDGSFSVKWLLYIVWFAQAFVSAAVACYAIYPTTSAARKTIGYTATLLCVFIDAGLLIAMLLLYSVCNAGVVPMNPCAYPADPTVASPLFTAIAISLVIHLALNVVTFVMFVVSYRILKRLVRVESNIRLHSVLNMRRAETRAI